jgi:hypothetical protein
MVDPPFPIEMFLYQPLSPERPCSFLVFNETPHTERESSEIPLNGGSKDKGFSEVSGGKAQSFPDLSVGEALTPAPKERENSGGGKFPSQISLRKDQPGNLGTKE